MQKYKEESFYTLHQPKQKEMSNAGEAGIKLDMCWWLDKVGTTFLEINMASNIKTPKLFLILQLNNCSLGNLP